MISVNDSPGRGRGVFADAPIQAGDVIERAPVLVLPDPQWLSLDTTELRDYHYAWGENAAAIVLGYGSLYNHSYTPNAIYVRNMDARLMEYVALRDIATGEEITINYNGDPKDITPQWFEAPSSICEQSLGLNS